MASSFSRKSNSSASKAPKPTYRRASTNSKPPSTPTRPASSASRPPSPGRPLTKDRSVRSLLPKKKAASASSGLRRAPSIARPRAASAPAARPARPSTSKSALAARSKSKLGAVKPKGAAGPTPVTGVSKSLGGALAATASRVNGAAGRLHIPRPPRAVLLSIAGVAILIALAALVLANSTLFSASDIQVKGSAHVERQTARALVDIEDGTTLLNVDEKAIARQLQASPWVKDVKVERSWPHTLIITPIERRVKALVYITADEIAWAIGDDGSWIAPVTLLVATDAQGNEVEVGQDGSVPEGASLLSSQDAALRIAQDLGCLLLTDVPSDISPKSGKSVNSKVVLAGLDYAAGFTSEFAAQIKSLSVASVEAISANLASGVEVSLGAPEHIVEKERVITKLLSQETGVTFINVREPGAYTFRSAPQ